jgi:hypothetical protein
MRDVLEPIVDSENPGQVSVFMRPIHLFTLWSAMDTLETESYDRRVYNRLRYSFYADLACCVCESTHHRVLQR